MRVQSISIKNFKYFKSRTFNFTKQFTLLIGDNSTGKTSILEALAIAVGAFLNGFNTLKSRNILPGEVRRETQRLGDATFTTELQFPVEISCKAVIDEKAFEWTRILVKEKGKTRTHAKELFKYTDSIQKLIRSQKETDVILPVLAYYSAGRTWSQKREKWTDPFAKNEISRLLGYTDSLESESNMKLFVRWLRRMTLIQVQKNKPIGELNGVLYAVETFLNGLTENSCEISIRYDFEEEEVIVDLDSDNIPLRMMSAGYRSVIGMVADLAYRMALLNPHLKDDAAKMTAGIVLIDELDLHLHPKWQWKIIKNLKRTFPKIQFIATTHAPIVIASCEENEIISLSEGTDSAIDSPNGWLVEDVLTDIMGTITRNPETEEKINRIRELYLKKSSSGLNVPEQEQLNTLSAQLQSQLPEGDPAVTLAKMEAIETKLFGSGQDA